MAGVWGRPPKEAQERRSIPAGLRFKILRRDGFTCQYCGRKAPEVELHVDHRVPWSHVRTHDIGNLVTACRDCNLGKGKQSARPYHSVATRTSTIGTPAAQSISRRDSSRSSNTRRRSPSGTQSMNFCASRASSA